MNCGGVPAGRGENHAHNRHLYCCKQNGKLADFSQIASSEIWFVEVILSALHMLVLWLQHRDSSSLADESWEVISMYMGHNVITSQQILWRHHFSTNMNWKTWGRIWTHITHSMPRIKWVIKRSIQPLFLSTHYFTSVWQYAYANILANGNTAFIRKLPCH